MLNLRVVFTKNKQESRKITIKKARQIDAPVI